MTHWFTELVKPQPWMARAACKGMGPDLFFPDKGANAHHALAICAGCAVRIECLEYATRPGASEQHGIWGGVANRNRRGIPTSRRNQAA